MLVPFIYMFGSDVAFLFGKIVGSKSIYLELLFGNSGLEFNSKKDVKAQ